PCLLERRWNLGGVLAHAGDANRCVDLATAPAAATESSASGPAGGLEVGRHNHARPGSLEVVDDIGGLGAANDEGIEVELLRECEGTDDLPFLAGVERHRHPAIECRGQRVKRGLNVAYGGVLVALRECLGVFLPLRVEERLPRERDDAQ